MLVEKKVFELPRYTTHSGAVIEKLRIGWESYGTLNRDRSNAILESGPKLMKCVPIGGQGA
jgi:homoserine O-acetyltransferase/O-succinyltransferase